MKKMKYLALGLVAVFASNCVQKTTKKTVVFELDASKVKNIKTVGMRGSWKPLKWSKSFDMTPVKKDSIYTASATFVTGYKFIEAKFLVNDEFELKEQDNRKVYFSDKDTTVYKAVFDVK